MAQQTGPSPKFKTVIGIVLILYAIFRIVTLALELPALMKFETSTLLVYGLLPGLIAMACLWIGGRMLWPQLRSSDKTKNGE